MERYIITTKMILHSDRRQYICEPEQRHSCPCLGFLTCARIIMFMHIAYDCARGITNIVRVCKESRSILDGNSLPHREIETASVLLLVPPFYQPAVSPSKLSALEGERLSERDRQANLQA